jgi:hypothetical protein
MNASISIKNGKFTHIGDDLCLAVGSMDIDQEYIAEIASITDIARLLFYYPVFKGIDLSPLDNTKIKHITFLHGNLDKNNFLSLAKLKHLKSIKLIDTQITSESIDEFKKINSKVSFK